MKKKYVYRLIIFFCLLSAFWLIFLGYNELTQEDKSKNEIKEAILNYELSTQSTNITPLTTNDPNQYLNKPKATPTPYIETNGVLEISTIHMKAPLTMGIEDYKLKSHAGLYPSLGEPGDPVVAIAAHSSWTTKCSYCFFENLEKLAIGDLIKIDYKGIKYVYEINEVTAFDSPDETRYFYPNDDQTEKVILITCTNGDSNVRTYVTANRIQ